MIKVMFEMDDKASALLFELPAVPDVGETISIGGDEYLVKGRKWGIDRPSQLVCVIELERVNA